MGIIANASIQKLEYCDLGARFFDAEALQMLGKIQTWLVLKVICYGRAEPEVSVE